MPTKVSKRDFGAFVQAARRPGVRGGLPLGGRCGETLLECILAMAIAAIVFVPAGASFRNGARLSAQTEARMREALSVRPVARTLATRYRLGETPEAFSFRLSPVRMEMRVSEPDESSEEWKYGQDLARIAVDSPLASRVLYARNAQAKRPERSDEE